MEIKHETHKGSSFLLCFFSLFLLSTMTHSNSCRALGLAVPCIKLLITLALASCSAGTSPILSAFHHPDMHLAMQNTNRSTASLKWHWIDRKVPSLVRIQKKEILALNTEPGRAATNLILFQKDDLNYNILKGNNGLLDLGLSVSFCSCQFGVIYKLCSHIKDDLCKPFMRKLFTVTKLRSTCSGSAYAFFF